MTVQAQQFRGILNSHPITDGLFKGFKVGHVYLFEVTVYVDDELHGNTCSVTIMDEASNISRTASFPSQYLKDLYIPYNSPAAKVLFGNSNTKY